MVHSSFFSFVCTSTLKSDLINHDCIIMSPSLPKPCCPLPSYLWQIFPLLFVMSLDLSRALTALWSRYAVVIVFFTRERAREKSRKGKTKGEKLPMTERNEKWDVKKFQQYQQLTTPTTNNHANT
jgi:hypothetical protein